MKLSISIVIPTFNGLELLQTHLPSVVKHGAGHQIIIVDDGSSDDSLAWLKQTYPQIKIISHTNNQGFSSAVNSGFQAAKTDLVLLLNNDVTIYKDTISFLEKHFQQNQKLFAVGAKEKLADGGERGRSSGGFSRGLLVHSKHPQDSAGPTLWVFAASGLFSVKIWKQLGGLDELYNPAYWEDIDIGYRAWKSGFECRYEPNSEVFHQGETTTKKVLAGSKAQTAFRNQLLFFWKNITDWQLILQHLIWTPYHLVFTTYRSRGAFLWGFVRALLRLDQVSRQPRLPVKLTDKQIHQLHYASSK